MRNFYGANTFCPTFSCSVLTSEARVCLTRATNHELIITVRYSICRYHIANSAHFGQNGYFGTQDYATYVTVVTQSKPPLSHTMHPVPYSRRIFNESMCIMSKSLDEF